MEPNEQPDKAFLNHEAKKAKWAADSEPHAERNPTEITEIPWLYVKRKAGDYPATTPQSGKWLVSVPEKKVNEVWAAIKQATEEGRLGQASMAATAMPKRKPVKSTDTMICVFTYDWTDAEDARRVRQTLRNLGITRKLRYKADEDTRAGKYGTEYKYYE